MKLILAIAIYLLITPYVFGGDDEGKILTALCSGPAIAENRKLNCRKCPESGGTGDAFIEKIYTRSFSERGVKESIIDLTGSCFGHGIERGATALLREIKGKWQLLAISPRRSASDCLKVESKKFPDALICETSVSNQGMSLLQELVLRVVYDQITREILIDLTSDADKSCSQIVHRAVRKSRILGDVNKDGELDLNIGFEVSRASRVTSNKKEASCEPPKEWKSGIYSLIYFRVGESFKLSPDSEPALAKIHEFQN